MKPGINWTDTLKSWKPSEGDCNLIQATSPLIGNIADVMKLCLEESRDSMVNLMSLRTKTTLMKDSISKWQLLELGEVQLREHLTLWETHINKNKRTLNLTVEFPVVVPSIPHLRYFKIIIQNGKQQNFNPKNISNVFLDYHEAKELIEVIYV